MKRVLYLDLVGGCAGDMLIAALVDAGVELALVQAAIDRVVHGIEVHVDHAQSAGLRAKRVHVHLHGKTHAHDHSHDHDHAHAHAIEHEHEHEHEHEQDPHAHAHDPAHDHSHDLHAHRPYRVVRALIEKAELEPAVKKIALAAFARLAAAEGKVHGVDPEEVEFHEVGSDDAIADVIGAAAAIHSLSLDEIIISPIPLGRGLTVGAHGPIPLPGPAAMELLKGLPLEATELRGETITPTGAALIATIATRFANAPSMIVDAIGIGAGTRSWPDRPNIVRAFLGRATITKTQETDEDAIIEANLDDMTPEHLAVLQSELFKAGAIDVWSSPIAMKKSRTGTLVAALLRRTMLEPITAAFFQHSTTLGVRVSKVARIRSERAIEEVDTPFGKVRVKISARDGAPPLVAPEHDDCERLARDAKTSVRAVYEAAQYAVWAKRGR